MNRTCIDIPHRRTPAALVVLTILTVLAGGCGITTNNAAGLATTTAPSGVKNFPVTIQNCGRTLTFDKPPTRVIAYVGGLDTLIPLGVQNTVVGRTHPYENPDTLPPGSRAAYLAIPEIAKGTSLPPKEPLLASGADFVIGSAFTDYDASSGHATRDELEAAGMKPFILGHACSNQDYKNYTFQNTLDDIRALAAVFGVLQRAEPIIRDLQARVDDITKRTANRTPLRVVTADTTEKAFYAPGSATYAWIISHAGGTSVFDGGEDSYAQVSVEEVAAANAQAYVIINYLPDTVEQRIARIEAAAPNSEGVRQRRYAIIQNSESYVGPRIIDGLEKVARVLHPEAFR